MSSRSRAWIHRETALAIHEAQLAEHGGPIGIRDIGLFESAVARPQNAAAYDPDLDVSALAALYAIEIVRSHPFVDGNKRVGAVLLEVFLELNGYEFAATDEEIVRRVVDLAAGKTRDDEFMMWIRDRARRLSH